MFIAEHVSDNELRYCSFEEEESFLRNLASARHLICPDCRALVRYRAGTKRPHFYHHRECDNPNPFSEPETGTHRLGKFVLYKWLKLLYPESRVELEYYLPETKQRSDVMILHPSGQRWAFEFQCSRITGSAWLERHELYKHAGVEDFWILKLGHFAQRRGRGPADWS
ncbi:competence protein CoiA family protein [Paenibacillus sp. CC-CFT747]|nr:competence protein CoiA family protein [Paenibacillus sp. CC-CFT747]